MGLGGISIWQLLIILAIVMLIFGTKRLRNIGGDLGGAIKGFRNAMGDDKDKPESEADLPESIETEAKTDTEHREHVDAPERKNS
jgi:sec-independent protein translocase protein TatA